MDTDKALEMLQRNNGEVERGITAMFTKSNIHRHALRYFDHVMRLAQSTSKAQAKIHLALAQEEHDAIVKLASRV